MPRGGHRPGSGRKKGVPHKELAPLIVRVGFEEQARAYGERMLGVIAKIAEAGETESARVSAAAYILDRGYGKARQSVDMKQTGTLRVRVHIVNE